IRERKISAVATITTILLIGLSTFAGKPPSTQSTKTDKLDQLLIYAPRPAYPYEARSKQLTGSGLVLLNVDPSSGNVTSAQMLKSTGHKILDDSALEAFRQWVFRAGSVRKVRIPINFTMQGDPEIESQVTQNMEADELKQRVNQLCHSGNYSEA